MLLCTPKARAASDECWGNWFGWWAARRVDSIYIAMLNTFMTEWIGGILTIFQLNELNILENVVDFSVGEW